MIINTTRFPLSSQCRRAAFTRSIAALRNVVSSPSPARGGSCACFSSVASQQQQQQQQQQQHRKNQSPHNNNPSPSSSFLSPHPRASINAAIDFSPPLYNDKTNSTSIRDDDDDDNKKDDSKNNETKTTTTTTTTTTIRNIQDFVDQIPEAVNRRKAENIEPGAFDDPVARLFRRSELPSEAWQKYALFDEDKPYTRNLISTDNETYTLLLLCWNPEKESPIHDHPCDGCWLQVLQGDIREVRYDKQLNCVSDLNYNDGALSYITDNVGYHKVGNTTQNPAVTLHLYAPPFESCQCWYSDTANPLEPSEGRNINHSEYGVVKVVA